MEPRDDRWDVDFVVGQDEASDDELLPEPPARSAYRNPLFVLATAVVVALAVLAGFRLASRQPTKPSALPLLHAPLVVHFPHTHVGRLAPVPDLREAAVDEVPAGLRFCPPAGDGQSACATSRHLPASVRAALRAHLPAVHEISGFEERLRDTGYGPGGLWYRQVRARLGSVTVTITVARRRIPQPEEVMMLPQYVGFSFHHTGFYVRTLVHVRGPQLVPILRLMALTRDPRLRAVA